ncbi:MAG: hypothetical protein IT445_00055 [Phycisphaeraceae bacterium]|nr:hypothetical protein [Phycisphaeraceae bacterium]
MKPGNEQSHEPSAMSHERRKARKRDPGSDGEVRVTICWPDGTTESARFVGMAEGPTSGGHAVVDRSCVMGHEDEADRYITVPIAWLTFHGERPEELNRRDAENAEKDNTQGELQ